MRKFAGHVHERAVGDPAVKECVDHDFQVQILVPVHGHELERTDVEVEGQLVGAEKQLVEAVLALLDGGVVLEDFYGVDSLWHVPLQYESGEAQIRAEGIGGGHTSENWRVIRAGGWSGKWG